MNKIKVAIAGFGNLGKGVMQSLKYHNDMELVAIVSRRQNLKVDNVEIVHIDNIGNLIGKVDVMILCGGSATDLPTQTPYFTRYFNTVDSYDNHSQIPTHFANVNKAAQEHNKISIISVGWDPGMFSINRLYAQSILPNGQTYTFWGKGVSQGHSDAIRRIEGVLDARQYTIPIEEAINRVRSGENPEFSTRDKHLRECFVVVSDDADKEKIETEIKTMPGYFADYDTVVHFISQQELDKNHSSLPHGGFVIHSGNTSDNAKHLIEYSLKLESNPEFTASILISYARAAYKLNQNGECGAKTIFDIAPALISQKSHMEIISEIL